MGYVCSDRGDSKKAIRFFEKALELEPWVTDHLYSIAADYRKLNQPDRALEYLQRIQQETPNDPDSYYYIADIYGEQDKIDEAINTLVFGLQQTNNDSALLYLLAYAYFVKGSTELALETLDLALDADFEAYPEFLEFDRELLVNNLAVIDLIEQHRRKNMHPYDPNSQQSSQE